MSNHLFPCSLSAQSCQFHNNRKKMLLILLCLPSFPCLQTNLIPEFGYPSQQSLHSSLCFLNNTLYTFGGADDSTYSNDLKLFNLTSSLWSAVPRISDSSPSKRKNSVSFIFQDKLFIYSGQSKLRVLNDLWMFDLKLKYWTEIQQSGELPLGFGKFSYLLHDKRLFICGHKIDFGSKVFQ